jgi:hypothetical protein
MFAPEAVQCYNKGSDGIDVNWECKADLDKSVKFDKLRVSCEGYEYPDDPYILAGSCVVNLINYSRTKLKKLNYNTFKSLNIL